MSALKDKPTKVVLDTNSVLSALLFNNSKLAQLRNFWQTEMMIPLASKATISELIRVLAYPKFKLSRLEQQSFLDEYLPYITTIIKVEKLANPSICRDRHDVMFLELALAGNADYLITGDKDLLEIQQPFKFQIITPAQFLLK